MDMKQVLGPRLESKILGPGLGLEPPVLGPGLGLEAWVFVNISDDYDIEGRTR